jgi:hypothetical protein
VIRGQTQAGFTLKEKRAVKINFEKNVKGNFFQKQYLFLKIFSERLPFAWCSSFGKEHRLNKETTAILPPLPHIWAPIRGRHWSAKVDDIYL